MANAPFRLRLAKAIPGTHANEFIPALPLDDGFSGISGSGRLTSFVSKQEQLAANLRWCFAANNAFADPTAAV